MQSQEYWIVNTLQTYHPYSLSQWEHLYVMFLLDMFLPIKLPFCMLLMLFAAKKKALLLVFALTLPRNPRLTFNTSDKIANYSIYSSTCWPLWKTSNSLLNKSLGVSRQNLKIKKITFSFWSRKIKWPVLDLYLIILSVMICSGHVFLL